MTDFLLKHRFFLGISAALCLVALSPFVWSLAKGLTPLEAPAPAPDLRLVLVNFWATWCPPCRKEFPSLSRVRKLFKPEEFEVLAVNVDEDRDTAQAFAGAPGFPILLDSNSRATMTWPVKGLPTSFIVDPQGRLALRLTGEQEFDGPEVVTVIRSLLHP